MGGPPALPSEKKDVMKKKIGVYWPLAIVVPLVAAAYLHLGGAAFAGHSVPLAADQVTAELARAVSYGLVGDEPVSAAEPVHAITGLPAAAEY